MGIDKADGCLDSTISTATLHRPRHRRIIAQVFLLAIQGYSLTRHNLLGMIIFLS